VLSGANPDHAASDGLVDCRDRQTGDWSGSTAWCSGTPRREGLVRVAQSLGGIGEAFADGRSVARPQNPEGDVHRLRAIRQPSSWVAVLEEVWQAEACSWAGSRHPSSLGPLGFLWSPSFTLRCAFSIQCSVAQLDCHVRTVERNVHPCDILVLWLPVVCRMGSSADREVGR